MNLIKYGLGLLTLLSISCNLDDTIPDRRNDKILVKEIVTENPYNKNTYKQNTFIKYNRNAFVTNIKTDIEYYDEQFLPDGTVNKGIAKINKTQTIHYKKDSLIDRIVTETGSLQEIKKFRYNDLNLIIAIEETNLNTHFKYNELGLVDQVKIMDKEDSWVYYTDNIYYDEQGNLLSFFHCKTTSSGCGIKFNIELYNQQHPFVNSNINLSFYDELRQIKGKDTEGYASSELLYNFEYVYKGKKAIKSIIHNNTYNSVYYDNYEITETNGDFISAYYREAKWLPRVNVYYNFY